MEYSKKCLESAIKHILPNENETIDFAPESVKKVALKFFVESDEPIEMTRHEAFNVVRQAAIELFHKGEISYGEEDNSEIWSDTD